MLKLAILEDHPSDAAYVLSLVNAWAEARLAPVHAERFPSAEAFLFHYEIDKTYDILLLDIEMSGMDGVTMATKIRRENKDVQIIFITGYSEYISEGYEVEALYYLMKPVSEEKLFKALDRAREKLITNERFLTLALVGETLRVPLNEIRYLDVQANYVTVHAKRDYKVKRALGEFEKLLDERFFRAGRALIVNLTLITRVTRSDVYLRDGTILPLPRNSYDAINRAIIDRV